MASKIEFAVDMTCNSCVSKVKQCLQNVNGINHFEIQLDKKTVIVDTILPVDEVQTLIKSTGKKAVIKGLASSLAAVAVIEFGLPNIQGVIRFMKNDDTCVVDGTVDGLQLIQHSLCIYECGDVSIACESVGSLYEAETTDGKKSNGVIGDFIPEKTGRASFRFTTHLYLYDLIGRSVVITNKHGDKLACGIIARSAGLFENPKTICACDGISIWDEQNDPKSSL